MTLLRLGRWHLLLVRGKHVQRYWPTSRRNPEWWQIVRKWEARKQRKAVQRYLETVFVPRLGDEWRSYFDLYPPQGKDTLFKLRPIRSVEK